MCGGKVIVRSGYCSRKARMKGLTKHLHDNNMTYWEHWFDAMKMCLALFIHAWWPPAFTTYVSDKLENRENK